MATRKTAAEKKAEEKEAAEAKAAEEASDESVSDEGQVDSVEDVLQPTGGEEGSLEESKAKEAEEKGEDPKEAEEEEKDEPQANPLDRDVNAEAAPFAGTAVAGSTEKTYNQVGQLYTDGLSGDADHNLDRAYGSGG